MNDNPANQRLGTPGAAEPLRGRVAIVTGSTGGLGFALAGALAAAGCDVVLNGLEPSEATQAKCDDLAETFAVRVCYEPADLASVDGVQRVVDTAIRQFGSLDILINNAVVRHFAPIVDFPVGRWEAALAVNLSAAFHAIRLALPGMRARNYGRIFNMTSVYGVRGTVNRVDYVTTKSALLGLTRSVALENLEYDITCHSICPGSVLTPGTEERIEQLMLADDLSRDNAERMFLEGKQPRRQFIPAQSVADLILFLCGPGARAMTGAMLPVDGGWLAS